MSAINQPVMVDWFKELDRKKILLMRIKLMIYAANFEEAAECFRFLLYYDSCTEEDTDIVLNYLDALPDQMRRPVSSMIYEMIDLSEMLRDKDATCRAQWAKVKRFEKHIREKTDEMVRRRKKRQPKVRRPFLLEKADSIRVTNYKKK